MRRLATIRRISEILPIENADAIELAIVDGWQCVVKKGEYKAGDVAIYFEIDSWIPHEIAPFLSKGKEPRVFDGVRGERLRTMRLRGKISQGLLLPTTLLGEDGLVTGALFEEGADVTEFLGIKKWELPDSTMQHRARGSFPMFIPKTDQERIQNLPRLLTDNDTEYEVTLKLDGSSMTVYHLRADSKHLELFKDHPEGECRIGVCSRNLEVELDGNHFGETAKAAGIAQALQTSGRNIAVQGELIGPGIQKNYEKVTENQYHIYAVFDIDAQEYLTPEEAEGFCADYRLQYIPIFERRFKIPVGFTVDDILEYAEGEGMNEGVKREGLVFKSLCGEKSFKAISNSYLLKTGN